jgi:hypothetical protein
MGDPINLSFGVLNLAIMPLWFGLLFFPKKRWVTLAIDVFVTLAALMFLINLIPGFMDLLPILLQPTLQSVALLLSTPQGTLGSWTHFVIADVWMGRWISQDAEIHSIPRAWVVVVLMTTLLFGPVGLLTYFITKLILRGRFGTDAEPAKSKAS